MTQDRTSRVMRSCLKSNLNIFVLQIRQVLGDALLWALQEMLNTECTNQVIEAWKELFKFITRPMLNGVEGDVLQDQIYWSNIIQNFQYNIQGRPAQASSLSSSSRPLCQHDKNLKKTLCWIRRVFPTSSCNIQHLAQKRFKWKKFDQHGHMLIFRVVLQYISMIQIDSQSLKLPDECGPIISDHRKQHCRNKRRLLLKPNSCEVIVSALQ